MPAKIEWSEAQIRGMEVMRKRGKTFDEIGYSFNCSGGCIRSALMREGIYKPKVENKEKLQKREIIEKELLAGKKPMEISREHNVHYTTVYDARRRLIEKGLLDSEESENKEDEKSGCNIMCCNARTECTEIDHPEECFVWQLYNVKSKKHLIKETPGMRKYKKWL